MLRDWVEPPLPGLGTDPGPPSDEKFEGHTGRLCGEHRTTGHRAWCFDCSEWCYPNIPCVRCEIPKLYDLLKKVLETNALDEVDWDLMCDIQEALK